MAMGRLGLVSLTHLSAVATKASELRYQGANAFERYANFITSLNPGRSAIAEELLAGYEGMSRDLMSRFNPDDSPPGVVNKLANLSFKWNGLTWLLNHQRQGGEEMSAFILGRQMDRPYDRILPQSQRLLRLYGIAGREWEMLRNAPGPSAAPDLAGGTRTYLTPEAANRIPEDQLISHLFATGQIKNRAFPPGPAVQRRLDAFREDLAMRLYAMFNDRSQRMVITPDIATRAVLLGGTQPGTAWGEFARSVAQFKTWPTAMLQTTIDRDWKGQPRAAAFAGTIQAVAAATITGYLIMSLKDLLKGKNPRDPASVKTWAAALMQGGGAGIMGDFLFGEYSRFGQSVSDTILGPVLGEGLSTAVDMWNRLKGKIEDPAHKHDIAPEMFRTLLDNTPFINILGVRTALNYLFLWQIQEALNPGSVRRFERRVKDQNHQTYWLSPSQAIGQSRP